MTPVEQAAAVYEREPCARSFREDLEAHLLHGVVVSTPEFFCMGRPVLACANREQIVDPWYNDFPIWDCWHLYLWAGPMMSAFQQATYPLTFVSFERKNRLRVYRWESIYAACSKHCTPSYRTSLSP
jgi:hypothetical protein